MFKKLLQLKTLLVALLVMAGAGNVWADEVTYTVTSTSAVSISGNAPTGSSAIYSSTYSTAKQLTKGNSMTLTLSGYAGKKITGLVLSMRSNSKGGAGNLSVKAGNTTIASIATAAFNTQSWNNSWSTSYVDKAVTISNDSYVIQNDEDVVITIEATANSLYCESFKLTYEGGGDTPILETSDLTLSPVSLSFDLYDEGDAKSVSFTTSSTGAVTVSESEYVTTSVSGNTITVTPVKVTPSPQTITVSQAADDTYAAGTATFTVSVADNTPDPYIWEETGISDLTSSDVFVIVGINSYNYAMTNDNGTSSAPSAIRVNIEDRKITSTVADNLKWSIAGDATNGYSFCPNGSTTEFLYCNTTAASSSNNNIRVGDGNRRSFVLENNYLKTKDDNVVRYVSVYDDENETSDWRGYVNTTTQPTTVKFYKRVDASAPQLSSSNVNIEYNATSGSISYTLVNPVSGGEVTAKSSENWLTPGTVTATEVPFTCTANEANTERTATVTLTYTYGDNETVTKDVTVTQAAYVDPNAKYNWVQAELADLTSSDVFVIVGDTYALSNNNGASAAPNAVKVTIVNNTLNAPADNLKWNISGNATDGYTFYPNGSTETWLYCTNTNNGVRVGTNDENKTFTVKDDYLYNTATSRYLGVYNSQDWRCYSTIHNNIQNQKFAFYKRVPVTDKTVMIDDEHYATLYHGTNLKIPSGVVAKTVTVNDEGILTVEDISGDVIPALTGVLLYAAESDNTEYTFNGTDDSSLDITDNNLTGVLTNQTVSEDGYVFFKLADGDDGLGFYYDYEGGASINAKAGKAFLRVSNEQAQGIRGFVLSDAKTGVAELTMQKKQREAYDLQGRRVSTPKNGLYIINGKKVFVK